MKSMKLMLMVMLASIFIAGLWNSVPVIKQTAHAILDPSAGFLLNWNKTLGMFVVVLVISLIMTLVQKYLTDQGALKKIKEEQKILQEEMKKYKEHPEKLLELQKKSFEFFPRTMDLTMKPLIYTFVPFILLLRWFNDYFSSGFKFFSFLSWFWFYLIFSIVFSSIFRKVLKVA